MHICYGYRIQANNDWNKTLGGQWRQYEQVFPALPKSSIDQVSLECFHSHVPPDLMALLAGKDVMVGVIDVASDVVGDARGSGRHHRPRAAVRAAREAHRLHQLRPGADEPGRGRGQAARPG